MRLHSDFVAICETYGQTIIQELFLREGDKSLRKRRIGGVGGGD